jgi:hypothetical protein
VVVVVVVAVAEVVGVVNAVVDHVNPKKILQQQIKKGN